MIEDILNQTTIEFPVSLNRERTEDLIKYIAKKLPAQMSYRVSYFRNLIHDGQEIKEDLGTVNITVNVESLKNLGLFDCFESIPDERDTSQTSAFRFNIVPGWEIGDYRPEIRQLWQDVREVVKEYFSSR